MSNLTYMSLNVLPNRLGIPEKIHETGNMPNSNKIAIICEMLQNIGNLKLKAKAMKRTNSVEFSKKIATSLYVLLQELLVKHPLFLFISNSLSRLNV